MEFIELREFAKEWLRLKKNYLKESTYYNYSLIIYNHIIPYFSEQPLSYITEKEIQNFILYLMGNKNRENSKKLSEKTTKDIMMVLKMILKTADKMGLYDYKQLELRYPRTNTDKSMPVILEEDKKHLIKVIYDNMNLRTLGILLCLQTGMRIGELCSLQWSDINLDYKLIHVSKTVQRIFMKEGNTKSKSKVLISSPKTSSSNRMIPISDTMKELLVKVCPAVPEYYFLSGSAKFLEPHTYRVYYQNFLRKNNLPKINFHSLRHTFASNCISMGADYKVVSELLGHASIKTTLDLYVHPQIEDKRQCIELICSKFIDTI